MKCIVPVDHRCSLPGVARLLHWPSRSPEDVSVHTHSQNVSGHNPDDLCRGKDRPERQHFETESPKCQSRANEAGESILLSLLRVVEYITVQEAAKSRS